MCSSATVGECLERGLVGAPKGDARLAEAVMRCREGDRVFMLNFSTKTLIGPFVCEARRGCVGAQSVHTNESCLRCAPPTKELTVRVNPLGHAYNRWVGGRLLCPDAWRNTSRGGAGAGVVCRFPWQIHVRPAAGAPARLPEADAACHLRRRGHTWDAFISEAGSNALWELMAGQVTSEPTPVQSSVVAPIAVLDAAAATPTPTPTPTPTSRPTLVTPAKSIAQQSGKRQGSTQQASAGEGQPDRKKPRQSPAPKTERRQAPAKAPPADSQPQELFGAQMQPKDLTYDPPEFIAIGDDMFE